MLKKSLAERVAQEDPATLLAEDLFLPLVFALGQEDKEAAQRLADEDTFLLAILDGLVERTPEFDDQGSQVWRATALQGKQLVSILGFDYAKRRVQDLDDRTPAASSHRTAVDLAKAWFEKNPPEANGSASGSQERPQPS
jgi:hypothetical protein